MDPCFSNPEGRNLSNRDYDKHTQDTSDHVCTKAENIKSSGGFLKPTIFLADSCMGIKELQVSVWKNPISEKKVVAEEC